MYDYKFKIDFETDKSYFFISSGSSHSLVLRRDSPPWWQTCLQWGCNNHLRISLLFKNWLICEPQILHGEKPKNILMRNIEGRERRARTWRPGRETTSPALGWFKNSYRNRFRLVWCILLVHRCEMYTEILSPSFVGMTFNQASVLCFSKVPHFSFSSSSNWIDDERYLSAWITASCHRDQVRHW